MSDIKLVEINNFKIKRIGKGKQKKILHKDLFDFPYFTAFMVGKSGNGKTNVLANILTYLVYCEDTKIIIVSSTLEDDKVYNWIIEKMGELNEIHTYDHLDHEVFDEIFELLKQNEEHEDYHYAKTILIIDDIKDCLKNPRFYDLVSKVRHFFSHIFVLSLYYKDITPGVRSNIRFLLLFPDLDERILKDIYDQHIGKISFQVFLKLYEDATKELYNFLYIDITKREYRKNLNKKYILN